MSLQGPVKSDPLCLSVSLTSCPTTLVSIPVTWAFLLFLEHSKTLQILFPLSRTLFAQVFSWLILSLHSDIFINTTI